MSTDIMSTVRKKSIALSAASIIALGGAFALSATNPASAAPIGLNALALTEAAPSNVVDVRKRRGRSFRGHRGFRGHRAWRGHRHHGGHAIAGLALGIIGAGIASSYYPYGYGYGPYCGYRYGYRYGYPYC